MKLKFALIGLGKQAKKYHIPGARATENAELVAVCDVDKARLEEVSSFLGVNGYLSVKELLDKEKIDFILIATPHDTHLDIIKQAASKGVHILKEKPFAMNLEEAKKIMEITKNNNVELMVTLQRRFNTVYARFFNYIKEIGDLSFIEIKYNIFAEDPHPEWRAKRVHAGGGCILDMGYHMIDILVWYFGLPSSIYSDYSTVSKNELDIEVEDSASIIFSYGSKCIGNIFLSRFSPPKTEYVKITGQQGILEIFKDKINVYGKNGEIKECLISKTPSDELSAAEQIDYFCEVISGVKENICGPSTNMDNMLFIEACYKSRKEKKTINPRDLFFCEKIKVRVK